MGLPGRTSLARILLLALALTCLPVAAAHAEPAAAAPQKGEAARPAARRTAFAPGRVLVGFEAGAIGGWTISSFVTSGPRRWPSGPAPAPDAWDGGDASPGDHTLRVLYTEPGGRALLRAFPMVLDIQRPRIADATAAPNPFEPRPRDGDRDTTTTFAMTSSERGRLRVVVYRYASTRVVRVVAGGQRAAGRQRVGWSGKTSSGACCAAASRTRSRPPTPPATPPGPDVTASVCCESQTQIIA